MTIEGNYSNVFKTIYKHQSVHDALYKVCSYFAILAARILLFDNFYFII